MSSRERAEASSKYSLQIATEQFTKPPTGTAVATERKIGNLRVGETTYVGDIQISTEHLTPLRKPATGTVARSEGAHAFLAIKRGIGVKRATIQPGPGYLGMVEVERPDAIVAAAHRTGNSHDERVIRWLGADVEASYRTAESMLRSDPDGYDAATALLEEKRTVNGHQIKEAITQAKERKEFVLVVFRTPDGRVFKRKHRTRNGEVTIEEVRPPERTIFDPHLKKGHVDLVA